MKIRIIAGFAFIQGWNAMIASKEDGAHAVKAWKGVCWYNFLNILRVFYTKIAYKFYNKWLT